MRKEQRVLPREDCEAMLSVAVDHYAAGRYPECTRLLRGLIVLEPDDARPLQLLGSVLLLTDYRSEAEAVYRQAIQLDPNDPYTLSALAEIALDALRLHEAADLLERLFAIDPNGRHPAANRGRYLLKKTVAALAGTK